MMPPRPPSTRDSGAVSDAAADASDSSAPVLDCSWQPSFPRTCERREDCAVINRQLSCCETSVTGIRADALPEYDEWKAMCPSQFEMCGCPDGSGIRTADDAIESALPPSVSCIEGVCRTTSAQVGQLVPCGPNSIGCDRRTEVCVGREPIEGRVEYACEPVPDGCSVDVAVDFCPCIGEALCEAPYDTCLARAANRIDCVCTTCE
jgi:hypothetical protein